MLTNCFATFYFLEDFVAMETKHESKTGNRRRRLVPGNIQQGDKHLKTPKELTADIVSCSKKSVGAECEPKV